MSASAKITATGNAGVHLATPDGGVFIDAFWDAAPRFLGGGRRAPATADLPAHLILVTHAHWDHFSPQRVAEAAARTGATVAGPQDVTAPLRDKVPAASLVALEPQGKGPGRTAPSATLNLPRCSVTAFRTFHGGRHNSYLVKLGRFSFFHDGDNEDTRLLDAGGLAPLDALLLCPWQGSGWPEFVERLNPRHWLLIHLDEQEIDQHRAGRFLRELADRVPLADRAVALGAGEALTID